MIPSDVEQLVNFVSTFFKPEEHDFLGRLVAVAPSSTVNSYTARVQATIFMQPHSQRKPIR